MHKVRALDLHWDIDKKLKEYQCVEHLIMFSATSKRGVDECREALTHWLEASEQEPVEA